MAGRHYVVRYDNGLVSWQLRPALMKFLPLLSSSTMSRRLTMERLHRLLTGFEAPHFYQARVAIIE